MTTIGKFIKKKRKEAHLTQVDFSIKSGLGLKFIRDLEQGKTTVRLDKVNQALGMFGFEAGPVRISAGETDE
ncbi:MAG: helix-turn-helix transcriptional regulator [Spirochaetia bacterium]|nr:helix-turn-helix transcriptional regulator [Spirochaetia bacterium]MBQ3647526.1 helix-turn-helix transcriptional regulator [Spirochaetia bacterium]MBQ6674264.1 helix-turn-helix transcriptional regulator [Spirochaetia bacterium]MBQ6905369.1 helix-turn-helix transcriptional regulator [Spirochaetia bacterium]MBR0319127.1 helix-turn-helix transcriptional regulator [Spirochaetia bacterium]